MVKRLLNAGNLMYLAIVVIASIYLIIKEGWGSYFNYVSILLALFIPIFIFIYLFKIIKQFFWKEVVEKKDIYILAIFILVAVAAYFVGLEKNQRVLLILLDSILCFFILLIMLYMTYKGKKG
jgi:hypothetical protein